VLIDFHNHILPGVDDGAATLEQSLSMLRSAADLGITEVVNTVHFQHPKVEGREVSIAELRLKMTALQEELQTRNIPVQLHLGAEVFYLPNLLQLQDQPPCTLGQGRYMLIEFALHSLPEGYQQVLFALKMAGVTPIIAHPERYRPIQEDVGIARHMVRAGALIQIDAGSLLGTLGQRAYKSSRELLRQRLCHFIGSDAHDDKKRNFCLPQATELGHELVGTEIEEIVFVNPKRLLNGEPIEAEVLEAASPNPGLFSRFRRRFWSR